MAACERCWSDARVRARDSGRAVYEEYKRLLEERKDNPCQPSVETGDDS